jgi:signal transduction histidine kinase
MWLLGAVLPVAGTTAAVIAGGFLFRANLERGVDHALIAQALSERVSLFDSPDIDLVDRPHIHFDRRGLEELDERLASSITIYGSTGDVVVRYPPLAPPLAAPPDARVFPGDPDAPPTYETRTVPTGRERVIQMTVARTAGENYVLEITAPLAHVDATVAAFYRVMLGIVVALAALLFVVHGLHARRLAGRVRRLADHMADLREGMLDVDAPPDPQSDEIGELSGVVAEATRRLREARAAQERLIADAAHELRTPLTLVRTSVDVALRRRREADELETVLLDVRGEVDRIAQLATRLLDAAATGQGAWDRSPGDLREVAREAVEAACGAAEEREILVQLEASEPVPAIFHAGGIRQALDNLLANALRYAPPRSTIVVRAWPLAGGGGGLAVHDDGPGIPAAERERVFEPFHRAGISGGAGLGLAIVRRIAEKHGGRAFAAEPSGGGTTVVMDIPGSRPRSAAAGT